MKSSLMKCVALFVALGLSLGVGALPASAVVQNWHLGGMIPLENFANDFHVKVNIEDSFLLGEPIHFDNGPFGADGTTTSGSTGFTVDWGTFGAIPVHNGGPHNFGFDIKVNGPFTIAEAWWTLNGVRVTDSDGSPTNDHDNYAQLFQAIPLPVPEPASLALLGMGMAAMAMALKRRRQQR